MDLFFFMLPLVLVAGAYLRPAPVEVEARSAGKRARQAGAASPCYGCS